MSAPLARHQHVALGAKVTALQKLINITHRRGIALARLLHALGHINATRRAKLARLENSRPDGSGAIIRKGGPDWSAYEPNVNVAAMASSGRYDFACRKITEGLGYVDPGWAREWRDLGLQTQMHRAAYHFGHPDLSASAQAAFFVRTLRAGGLRPTDILVIDIEVGDVGLDTWTDEYLLALRRLAPGNEVWVYDAEMRRRWAPRPGRPVWVAALNGRKGVESLFGMQGHVVLHQFSFNARVAGVAGTCDLSCTP